MPFHFAETNSNLVTLGAFDPISREPNFKQCAVRVERTSTHDRTPNCSHPRLTTISEPSFHHHFHHKKPPLERPETMANMKALPQIGPPPNPLCSLSLLRLLLRRLGPQRRYGPIYFRAFHLSPAQIGLMVSVPTLAGAFMRFPLGVLSQYIGRKNAAIVEMSAIVIALLYGFFFVHTFNDVLAMGVLLALPEPASAWRSRSVPDGSPNNTKVSPWALPERAIAARP